MGQDINNPQSLNRYTYCFNNPLKYTDPSGHFAFAGFAKLIVNSIKSIQTAAKLVVDSTKVVAKSMAAAVENAGKGLVENAVKKCEPAIMDAKARGDGGPIANFRDNIIETALEKTLPLDNSLGAGIRNIEVKGNKGYIELDVSERSWMTPIMNGVLNAGGVTLPVPGGSLVIVREDLYNSTTLPLIRAHEEVHVTQQDVLGWKFLPFYLLGNMLYGYKDNPFETQAVNTSGY